MLTRRLAVILVVAVTSVAQAGAIVQLVPAQSANEFNPCGYFDPGEVVTVGLYLAQSPVGTDHAIRLVQVDLRNSDPLLTGLPTSATWVATGMHFAYYDAARQQLSNTYYERADDVAQVTLPGDGSRVKVGEFDVTMPFALGSYVLDVLNATATHPDEGGQVRFGFGTGGDPITAWRADTGDLTDGTFTFEVINQAVAVLGADPAYEGSLWRSAGNVSRIEMDLDIVAPVAGEVEVRELLAGGGVGGDLSASFSFTVENTPLPADLPRILVVKDTGPNLTHGSWYTILNSGAWAAASPFKVHYQLSVGDANGDGRVLFNDLSLINSTPIPCGAGCPPRNDINGDGRVLFNDLSVANSNIPWGGRVKPSGHDCQ